MWRIPCGGVPHLVCVHSERIVLRSHGVLRRGLAGERPSERILQCLQVTGSRLVLRFRGHPTRISHIAEVSELDYRGEVGVVIRMVTLSRDQVERLAELVAANREQAAMLQELVDTLRQAAQQGAGVRILAHPERGGEWPVLTPAEVARIYGVSAQMVRRWCADGKLPGAYKRPGGGWAIPLTALLEATHVPRPGRRPVGALATIAGLLKDRPEIAQAILASRNDEDRELPAW
ncbi:DNA-binding protein (plasmid) [Thermaerobacter sp. FW80]|nr:DNA-binding protein [Thermaerobacter sp. FW80]QBS38722.1 DNA-binding protein [Thermaerobacter sp. FW80]